jgi:hypothetical protein
MTSMRILLSQNWVKGAQAKRDRFERHHFILYDPSAELCIYPTEWGPQYGLDQSKMLK